jgi:hypothetical protein
MKNLTPEGARRLEDVAMRHGVSLDAVSVLLDALAQSNGSQAQFNHPDLRGSEMAGLFAFGTSCRRIRSGWMQLLTAVAGLNFLRAKGGAALVTGSDTATEFHSFRAVLGLEPTAARKHDRREPPHARQSLGGKCPGHIERRPSLKTARRRRSERSARGSRLQIFSSNPPRFGFSSGTGATRRAVPEFTGCAPAPSQPQPMQSATGGPDKREPRALMPTLKAMATTAIIMNLIIGRPRLFGARDLRDAHGSPAASHVANPPQKFHPLKTGHQFTPQSRGDDDSASSGTETTMTNEQITQAKPTSRLSAIGFP